MYSTPDFTFQFHHVSALDICHTVSPPRVYSYIGFHGRHILMNEILHERYSNSLSWRYGFLMWLPMNQASHCKGVTFLGRGGGGGGDLGGAHVSPSITLQ